MSVKEQMTLAAALAVGLATGAFWPVFEGQDWLWRTLGAVLVVMISGLLTRRMGLPRPLQPLLALALLAGYVAVVFAGATLDGGVLPTSRTVDALQSLVDKGQHDISAYGPPVPASTGLVLLTVLGVGAVALVVDLLAVVLDRAAVAGLPLLALFAVPAAVLPNGLGTLPFVLGATGWLGMLLVEGSDRVLRWGTPMRSSRAGARAGGDDSSLGRVGRRIGVAAVGAALVVPLLIPGLGTGLVGGSGSGPGAGGGGGSNSQKTYNPITKLGEELNLRKPKELLQYRTSDPQPDYLRMTTLDTWTGDGWMASELNASQRDSQVQKGIRAPIGDSGPHRSFTMQVKIHGKNLNVYWLPVPFGPTKVDVNGLWLWEANSQTIFSAQRTTKDLPRYDIQASRPVPTRDDLALADMNNVPADIRDRYGKDIPLSRSVRDLAHRLTDAHASEYDKAVALQDYFTQARNGFSYNTSPSQPRAGQDHLEAFLEGKQGFCEQYASAMAAMLRAVGIPSRVAVGFTPGISLGSGFYSVTTNQAHAWPEAWFAGTGWVRFEPTPAQSGAIAPAYTQVPATRPGGQPLTLPTAAPTPTTNVDQLGRIRDPDLLNPNAAPAAVSARRSRSGRPSYWVLGAAGLGLLLVGPQLLTFVRRRHRWFAPTPLTAWAQLRDDAADVGFRWHEADSPRTAAAQLQRWRPLPVPAVEALGTLALAAERARYAPPERQVAMNLRPQVQLLRAALQDCAPLRTRLRARFATPSTLRWVREGIADALAAVTNRLDDAISSATRPLRRAAAR